MRRNTWQLAPLVAVAAIAAGCGGGSDGATLSDEEQAKVDAVVDEVNRTAPSAGLGEGSPPIEPGWSTDLSKHSVPLEEITSGGPPKDGIPAIDEPSFETALGIDWLSDPEPVIAVAVEGVTRGYRFRC